MDFARWNTIARGEQRNLKKISELTEGRVYILSDIQKTTTKYGEKITVGLAEEKTYCYLPSKLSEALLKGDEEGFQEIRNQLESGAVGMRRLPQRGRFNPVEFVPINEDDSQDVK